MNKLFKLLLASLLLIPLVALARTEPPAYFIPISTNNLQCYYASSNLQIFADNVATDLCAVKHLGTGDWASVQWVSNNYMNTSDLANTYYLQSNPSNFQTQAWITNNYMNTGTLHSTFYLDSNPSNYITTNDITIGTNYLSADAKCFRAYAAGDGTKKQAIADATLTALTQIDAELFDTVNCYNTTTCKFTPTNAGYWMFNAKVLIGGGDTDAEMSAWIGWQTNYLYQTYIGSGWVLSNKGERFVGSVLLDVTATGEVYGLVVYIDGTTGAVSGCSFGGIYLGE